MSSKNHDLPEALWETAIDAAVDGLTELDIKSYPMENLTIEDLFKPKATEVHEDFPKGKKKTDVIAFGSCQERPIIPNHFPFTRMGITSYYRSHVLPGPATYNIDDFTSNYYVQETVTSANKKGWGFGNRTEIRFPKTRLYYNIDPGRYQPDLSLLPKIQQCKPPFGMTSPRFKEKKIVTPGPGTYNPDTEIGKQLRTDLTNPKNHGKSKSKINWSKDASANRKKERLEQYFRLHE